MRNVIQAVGVVLLVGVGCSGSGTGGARSSVPGATEGPRLSAAPSSGGRSIPVTPAGGGALLGPAGAMGHARAHHAATLLRSGAVLVVGGWDEVGSVAGAELYDPATGDWTPTGALATRREAQTATPLATGEVLVTGGWNATRGALAGGERYDPATGAWTPDGDLVEARSGHTATLLPDGSVLVAGGRGPAGGLASAERYDPVTRTWRATGSMSIAREDHTATLLPDGRVLVAGGSTFDGAGLEVYLASAELYDPAAGTWSPTGAMTEPRLAHTATLLLEGQVLVAGGRTDTAHRIATAERYDPGSGRWTATGPLAVARSGHRAALLPSGRVLALGGRDALEKFASVEEFDPGLGQWTTVAPLGTGRDGHTATLLASGRILVAGGSIYGQIPVGAECYEPAAGAGAGQVVNALAEAHRNHTATVLPSGAVLVVGGGGRFGQTWATVNEAYDPVADAWAPAGALAEPRSDHTATHLGAGRVLVVAGLGPSGPLASAEQYDPASGWSGAGSLPTARYGHTATRLPSGLVLVAGGTTGAALAPALADVQLFDPSTGTWADATPMATARSFHSATLLPGGKVLVAGGQGNSELSPTLRSAELYDPATGGWEPTGDLTGVRSGHLAALLSSGKVLIVGGWDAAAPVASAELFDPASGTWSPTGAMGDIRQAAAVTSIGTGDVLVSGGVGNGGFLADAERFDQVTGTWGPAGAMPLHRSSHTATWLPSGQVLMAGGIMPVGTAGYGTETVERFDEGRGAPVGWSPSLRTVPPVATAGGDLTLTGAGFTRVPDGADGTAQSSSIARPMVQLRSEAGTVALLAATLVPPDTLRAVVPNTFLPGPAWVQVIVAGRPSEARALSVAVPPLRVGPAGAVVPPRGAAAFAATGGRTEGYRYSLATNRSGGTIGASDGAYHAGAVGDVTDVVQVVDPYGARDSVGVTVTAGVTITPSSKGVPSAATLRLAAAGGSGTGFTWTLQSNRSNASLTAGGVYVAGVVAGETDVVRVQDDLGNLATASLTVLPPLVISPAAVSLQAGGSRTFTASGGTGAGYRWSLATNASGGSIGEATGVYAAGPRGDVVDVVRLTDGDFSVTREVTVTAGAAPAGTENPFQASCGQGPAGAGSLLALGALLLLRRRVRGRGVSAALTALALAAVTPALAQAPAQPARRPGKAVKVVVVPMSAGPGLEPALAEAMTGVVVAELTGRGIQVVTPKDVETALVVERQKQMLGCTAANCLTELAGAMGTDLIVSGGLSVVGKLKVVTVQLFNARAGAVQRNFQEQLANAEPEDLLDAAARAGQELFPETRSASAGPRRRTLLAAAPSRSLAVELGGAYEPSGPGGLGLLQLTWRLDAGVRLSAGALLSGGGHPGAALRAAWVPFDRARVAPYLAVQGVGVFAGDALFGAGAAIGLEWAISDRLSLSPELGALWLLSAPRSYKTSYLLPGVRLGWAL